MTRPDRAHRPVIVRAPAPRTPADAEMDAQTSSAYWNTTCPQCGEITPRHLAWLNVCPHRRTR